MADYSDYTSPSIHYTGRSVGEMGRTSFIRSSLILSLRFVSAPHVLAADSLSDALARRFAVRVLSDGFLSTHEEERYEQTGQRGARGEREGDDTIPQGCL